MKEELTSREKRRRRRVRNQIMAYITMIILIVVVFAGSYYGFQEVLRYIKGYNEKVNDAFAEAESSIVEEIEEELLSAEFEESTDVEIAVEELDPLDELVYALLNDMTLEEKVAGMFMVSPESITGVGTVIQAGDATKTAIAENPVGGILYSEKNFKSKEQFIEMLTNTKSFSKYPLFMAVCKESGQGTSFGVDPTPIASELTETDKVNEVYSLISEQLFSYGINMNMAPVAEISSEDGDEQLKGRVFSSDAATAAPLVNVAVQTMQGKEISAVLQKFPGESAKTKTLEELRNSEFIVYEMAVKNGVDCIMVSHVVTNEIAGDGIPSSLSKVMITDVLRNSLGFKGIVITDSFKDSMIAEKYNDTEAAVEAIKAGADIILEPSDYKVAYEGILAAVAEGEISQERIDESLYRIYRVKYKNALNNSVK